MTGKLIVVPDLGGAEEVEVIEVSVAPGDVVETDQTLLVLESDKAMMEIPAPCAGTINKLFVAEGDKIEKEGDPLVEIDVSEVDATVETSSSGPVSDEGVPQEADSSPAPDTQAHSKKGDTGRQEGENEGRQTAKATPEPKPSTKNEQSKPAPKPEQKADSDRERQMVPEGAEADGTDVSEAPQTLSGGEGTDDSAAAIYAGPAVRQLARELGVELAKVTGSGPRGRLLKEDVQAFVKTRLTAASAGSSGIPGVPDVDFSLYGPIEQVAMSRIDKLTASNMHRSWLNVPHVTQFDDADISELETFRLTLKAEGEKRGVKMTPVPIILKACAVALNNNPVLNRSLHSDGEHFIQKHYFHIGMAVDTPRGLLVPVLHEVDKKSLWQIAEEVAELAGKAREGKLKPEEMQGGCFTVSSLGTIGGQGFTPVINTPQAAILGVSKAQIKPVWDGQEFTPRNMLPLSLSYDHRIVNGGDAGRFMTELVSLLGDIRRLLL